MYSREKRIKAINLYIKYDKSAADAVHELGYPDRKSLQKWYRYRRNWSDCCSRGYICLSMTGS